MRLNYDGGYENDRMVSGIVSGSPGNKNRGLKYKQGI